jgi:hypothetical protein
MPDVTESDRYLWVATISPQNLTHRHYRHYVKYWDVDRKIVRAKSSGHWPPVNAAAAINESAWSDPTSDDAIDPCAATAAHRSACEDSATP